MRTELGTTMRDKITGFAGVATGRAEYISGCVQVLLAPKAKEDGSFTPSEWFDEQRLEPMQAARVVLDNGDSPGPDRPAPRR
jgi:hypothetical protein